MLKIIDANIKKDTEILDECWHFAKDLRIQAQAMKIKAAGRKPVAVRKH